MMRFTKTTATNFLAMKLESPLWGFFANTFLIAVISFSTRLMPASPVEILAQRRNTADRIIGQWRGLHHVRAFYADGSFFIDPEPEGRPVGKWSIRGNLLAIRLPGETTERIEQIVKLTSTEMIVTADRRRYVYKRINHY